MAIVFSYTASTNITVVTGGTSGTPATFADFVTADRAGTGTSLKAATAASKTLTLTYAVRPVEYRAIVVKLIVASKTTETDYIFITGTDAWDAAQTENIDVSAGNGTYTSTKRWRTITNISCSDATDGTGTLWADGTLAITQDIWGVIWNLTNGHYQVDSLLTWGDGSTATYFKSEYETIVFNGVLASTASSNVRFGIYNSGKTKGGCRIRTNFNRGSWGLFLGVHEFYDIIFYPTNTCYYEFRNTVSIQDARFEGASWVAFWISTTNAAGLVKDVFFTGITHGLQNPQGSIVEGITYQDTTQSGFRISGLPAGSYTYKEIAVINPPANAFIIDWFLGSGTTNHYLINCPSLAWNSISWSNNSATVTINVHEQYLFDLHVADKDGADIESATVALVDKNSSSVFSVSTDANGDIVQQTVTASLHIYHVSETATTLSPFVLTISKAGYQTLVMENITVSAPIKWHVELQPAGTANMSRVRVGH